MFLGINIFWALLRAHFNPLLMAQARVSLSWGQNTFMPGNKNSIVLLDIFPIVELGNWCHQQLGGALQKDKA